MYKETDIVNIKYGKDLERYLLLLSDGIPARDKHVFHYTVMDLMTAEVFNTTLTDHPRITKVA
jgi:hypothetical protein